MCQSSACRVPQWHGKVVLKGSRIQVSEVQTGAEETLRHFLESVVLQVNSDLGLESETRSEDAGTGEPRARERGSPEAVERRIAATFRGFADDGS